jgi:monofunctional biosynthetic peptidoglycan transglycosylase
VIAAALGVLATVVLLRASIEVAGADIASLAARPPRRTALMLERERDAAKHGRRFAVDQRWMPYDRVSPLLRRAVLVAEDDAFFSHDGLDWTEIEAAARRNLEAGRTVRGASTITQQLAKNLFLGSERSLARKLKEALLALRLEHALSKRRIFELYLNEIEWGDGVFGAEAAARRYFGVAAADLDARQAVLLAAVIINPRRYSPLRPAPRIERRVAIIAGRLHRRGALDDAQYDLAMGRARPGFLRRLFGGGGSPDTSAAPAPVDTTGP